MERSALGFDLGVWSYPDVGGGSDVFCAQQRASDIAYRAGWEPQGLQTGGTVALANRLKYIAVPLLSVVLGAVLGATVGKTFAANPLTLALRINDVADDQRPLIAMLIAYLVWNTFHFGMRNYGLLSLYFRKADRAADAVGHVCDPFVQDGHP